MRKKRSGKYKLRKLFFGRVIIFSGSGTRIRKAAAVVLAAAVLTFAAGTVGTGYNGKRKGEKFKIHFIDQCENVT